MAGRGALFTPLQIGDITLKNRVTMAALTRNRAENTYATDLMKEYFLQRVDAGLLVTDAILVSRQGTEWQNAPGLWEEKQVEGWKNITDAIHKAGSKIYAQLWHTGRVSHPNAPQQILSGLPVYGSSAIKARGGKFRFLPGVPGYVKPTAVDNPRILIEQFRQAALLAKKAGFDGVELHGANGYLINQFFDSTSNKRSDEWGGSPENRCRFALEVLKVVVDVFGTNVAIKISPCGGYNDIGMPLQETLDTYCYFFSEADKLNLAYFSLVRYSLKYDVEFDGVRRATKHDVLASYKPYIKNTKLILNADILPEEGEKLVASGEVDAISIGVPYILHPDLLQRYIQKKPYDNIPNWKHMQVNKSSNDWVTGYMDYPLAT